LNETRNTQSRGPGGRGRGGRGRGERDKDDVEESTNQTRQQNWHGRGQERGQTDLSKSEVECFRCGKYDHYAREYRSASCYNCGKVGHIAKFCQTEKKGEKSSHKRRQRAGDKNFNDYAKLRCQTQEQ